MNKRIKRGLLILIPSTLSLLVGWKIGTIQGSGVAANLYEASKSATIVNELKLLRKREINDVIELKEISLDSALLSHSLYLENGNGWIIYPFNKMLEPTLEKSLVLSAEYRKSNPRYITTDTEEIREAQKRVDALLKGKQH